MRVGYEGTTRFPRQRRWVRLDADGRFEAEVPADQPCEFDAAIGGLAGSAECGVDESVVRIRLTREDE